MAATVSGAIDQAGGLALTHDVDTHAVKDEPARAEIAMLIGAQLAG
jgi:hypothetical protein